MLVQLNMLNHVIWAWVKIGYSNHWMVNTKDRPTSLVPEVLNFDPYPYGNNIWICGGRARPRGPGGCMKYQFVCLNGWAGQEKTYENLPGGSLEYLFGYFKVRIFKSSYRIKYPVVVDSLIVLPDNLRKTWGVSADDLPNIFKKFDADGNGELGMDEFIDFISRMKARRIPPSYGHKLLVWTCVNMYKPSTNDRFIIGFITFTEKSTTFDNIWLIRKFPPNKNPSDIFSKLDGIPPTPFNSLGYRSEAVKIWG